MPFKISFKLLVVTILLLEGLNGIQPLFGVLTNAVTINLPFIPTGGGFPLEFILYLSMWTCLM